MRFNENNSIISNVLTKEEIEEIYWLVSKSYNSYLMKTFTQKVSDFDLPYRIAKKIISHAENISGTDGLEIESYQFARYQNVVDEDGNSYKPNLTPHCDLTFPEPRFTIDYQIGSNTDWTIVVEGKDFTLSDNQAVTFSGTHQVHWRKPKIFMDSEYVDMVFFHLRKRTGVPYSKEIVPILEEKIMKYTHSYREQQLSEQ